MFDNPDLSPLDIERGWYLCPRCRYEVAIWPTEGADAQVERDLCAECADILGLP